MKVFKAISLNRDSDTPMYLQLYESMKSLIENGSIEGNEKLPAIRSLAKGLCVNNVTVVNAYKLLEQKGYAYSRVGSGTFVMGSSDNKDFSTVDMMEQGYVKIKKDEINFSTSTPNPRFFPVDDFKQALNEVLERDGGLAFGYQEAQGYLPLRESINAYLKEKGIDAALSDIHVISGAQQGIDIISKVLVRFNDRIVVESPTYTGAMAVFKSRGANIIEVPMMEDGIDTKELEKVLKAYHPKLIYVMTNFQNPTGISYSQDKKLQLLYLAEKYDLYILEDEYLSELNFYNEESMPIKALDANHRIIYIKSFSKIFMPGIRLGFIVAPEAISKAVLLAKHNTDISTSSFMQRAFDLYLRKKKWEQHMEMMREIYKNRYDKMVKELNNITPFIDFTPPKGGIHIWCRTDIDSSVLGSEAKKRGTLIAPGRLFYLDERENNCFRISYAGIEEDEILKGLKILNSVYMDLKNMNSNSILPFL